MTASDTTDNSLKKFYPKKNQINFVCPPSQLPSRSIRHFLTWTHHTQEDISKEHCKIALATMAKACHNSAKLLFMPQCASTCNTSWASQISVTTSALGWSEWLLSGMDRGVEQGGWFGAQASISWAGDWEKLPEKAALPPTTIHQEWKRHLYFSQRGCPLCCRSGITHHVLLQCDIFQNSINLSSVSATLICVWQYLFPFKSPPTLRTSVTRQNYTLHSLLKWEGAQVMKDMWFKLPF